MSVTSRLPRHHRLLATLALHGRLAGAATLFSTAVRTTHALNSLLAAVCSSQSFLRIAPKVLLLAVPSASPDAATFRILTSALCRARQPSAAADILRCMPSLLLDPDLSHCRAVLFSLCQCGPPASEAVAFLVPNDALKNPSQSAMTTLISKRKNANKPLVVAGCVPQGSRDLKELEGISIIGAQQIDWVVEVVEENLKGLEVRLLSRKTLPSLDLPKVRKNKFIVILPINVGCLGACTYCKTKYARGHLGSYSIDSLVGRVKIVVSEGV